MEKSLKKLWTFFIVIGLFFVIAPLLLTKLYVDKQYTIETEAVITKIEIEDSSDGNNYYTYVSYTIDDTQYNSVLHSYSSDFYEGKTIIILVDKDSPSNIMWKSSKIIVFGSLSTVGCIFFLIGVIGFYAINNKIKRIEKVRINGSTIVASYVGTRVNKNYSYNGKHPYVIMCSWVNPQNNVSYSFESEYVWKDPTHEIEGRHIDSFRVFINPNNPSEYSVDIDNIKNSLM